MLPIAAQADALDAELARRLVESGRILPLEQLLERVQLIRSGVLLEAELEYESEQATYVYEIELLDDAGQVWEFELDAETGEPIELSPEHVRESP
ncbi:MAG: peptidase [Gammaproteobacteria bacterium]|nr:peptidase [Gammaproteobacteria bacterium]